MRKEEAVTRAQCFERLRVMKPFGVCQLEVITNLIKRACFSGAKGLGAGCEGLQCERGGSPYLLTVPPSIRCSGSIGLFVVLQGHQLSLHWEPLPIRLLLPSFSVPSYFCIFCSYLTLHLFWDTWFSKVELDTLLLCFHGTRCTFTMTMVCTHGHYNHLSTCLSLSVGLWAPQGRASTVLLSSHMPFASLSS